MRWPDQIILLNFSAPPPRQPRRPEDPHRRLRLAEIIGIAAAVAGLAAGVAVLNSSIYGRLASIGAGVVAGLQALEGLDWQADGYFSREGDLRGLARNVLAFRFTTLLVLAVASLTLHSSEVRVIVGWVCCILLAASHARFAERVNRRTSDEAQAVPPLKGARRALVTQVSAEGRPQVIRLTSSRNLEEVLLDLIRLARWSRGLPRYAPLVVTIMLLVSSIAVAVGLIGGHWPDARSGTGAPTGNGKPKVLREAQKPPGHEQVTAGQKLTRAVPALALTLPWDGPCPPLPPSPATLQRAREAFERLYLSESHLQPSDVGCITSISAHKFGQEFFASALGTNLETNAPLSYALDSERYGSVLVLASAMSAIQKMTAEVGTVGGVGRFPYYKAAEGDFYLLRTRLGVAVLIRRLTTESYELLPPTVARAWLGAMNELEEWLWPEVGSAYVSGPGVFPFSTAVTEQNVAIELTADGTARRGGFRYHPASEHAHELSGAEVVAFSHKA